MKDWCHTNNTLQVCSWGCLVVQVMFHALLTPSMTSPGHIVGQILKLRYLRQYFSYRVDQRLKISEMLMAILLVYSTSGITSGKTVCRDLKMAAILKYEMQLHSDLRYEKTVRNIAKKSIFHGDDVIHYVTGWPQSRSSIFLYKWNKNIFHDNWNRTYPLFIIQMDTYPLFIILMDTYPLFIIQMDKIWN